MIQTASAYNVRAIVFDVAPRVGPAAPNAAAAEPEPAPFARRDTAQFSAEALRLMLAEQVMGSAET